ncbi:hypothetical protein D3C72_2150000 [compost metagenome]
MIAGRQHDDGDHIAGDANPIWQKRQQERSGGQQGKADGEDAATAPSVDHPPGRNAAEDGNDRADRHDEADLCRRKA